MSVILCVVQKQTILHWKITVNIVCLCLLVFALVQCVHKKTIIKNWQIQGQKVDNTVLLFSS